MFTRDILTDIVRSVADQGLSVRATNEAIREAHRRALGGYVITGRRVEVIRFIGTTGLIDRVQVTA